MSDDDSHARRLDMLRKVAELENRRQACHRRGAWRDAERLLGEMRALWQAHRDAERRIRAAERF